MPLRWVTLVALLVLTSARPLPAYTGIRTWILITWSCWLGCALLRRANDTSPAADTVDVGASLTIDTAAREVRVGGVLIPLTSTEYSLLEALVQHAGVVVTHHALLEYVWGQSMCMTPTT